MSRTAVHAPRRRRGAKGTAPADEWVGGRFPMPSYVMEDPPFRPDIAVWVEAGGGCIVGSEVLRPEQPGEAVVACLEAAMVRPAVGPPRRPAAIRVEDEQLARLVRERVGPGISVRVAATPEVNEVQAAMERDFGAPDDQELSYLEAGRVSADTIGRFFAAAAELYRQAPWRRLPDDWVLELSVPSLGLERACVSIIGALGENFGALIFESLAGFESMTRLAAEKRRRPGTRGALDSGLCSISFDKPEDLPSPRMRQEIKTHGWELAGPRAYPWVHWVDPDLMNRPLTDAAYRLATACALALARFFAQHGAEVGEGSKGPGPVSLVLEELPGQPVAQIVAPHPQADWLTDDLPDEDEAVLSDAELAELEEEEAEEEEAALSVVHKLAKQFVATEKRGGRAKAWLNDASFLIENLFEFKVRHVGGLLGGLDADLVEEYLLEFFPAKVSTDDELVERTPEILIAFFDWMVAQGEVRRPVGAAICRRVRAKSKAFARAARDPARFGRAKSIVMSMQDAGVDISNKSEVDGFIKALNAGQGVNLPLVGAPFGAGWRMGLDGGSHLAPPPNEPRVPHKAWVWSGDGTPPTPAAPCPCGSGKRYKKCCMPR